MVEPRVFAEATELLHRDGRFLDTQNWDAWLELYAEHVEYWVPAWKSESELVSDVQREVSLIYHTRRAELAERILRIRTRKSVTAMPLPRTAHQVANLLIDEATGDRMRGTASWTVHEYDPRSAKSHTYFGHYEFELGKADSQWRFVRKKIVLLNERVPTVIDFYNL